MKTIFSEELTALLRTPQATSLYQWLDKWLNCSQPSTYFESICFLEFVIQQFSTLPPSLNQAVEEVLAGYGQFEQARHNLQQASMQLSGAEEALQQRLATMQKVLTELADQVEPVAPARLLESSRLPALEVRCLGGFEVVRQGQALRLCANRKGQIILRYLVAQPLRRATLEELLEVLWPQEPVETSRQKLHIAASAARNSLNQGLPAETGGGYLLCRERQYLLNPAVEIQTDVDQLLNHYRAGKHSQGETQATHYEKACRLYRGPFMVEDLYEDWPALRREQLTQLYLEMCLNLTEHYLEKGRYNEAVQQANLVLHENRCEEVAYQQLIRAYGRSGRRAAGLQQYQRCQAVLKEELDLSPLPETTRLYEALLQNQPLPPDF